MNYTPQEKAQHNQQAQVQKNGEPPVKPQEHNSYTNQKLRRNSIIFGIMMLSIQIAIILIYSFLIEIPQTILNVSSVIIMILFSVLIIAGFGLLFGYTPKLLWTSIGFNLLILALCIQLYPLINSFWTKTVIMDHNTPITDFDYSKRYYNLYLTDRESGPSGTSFAYYGNTLSNALKCALAVAVAYSAILGRSGQLQCLFVTIFGIIGFELNRQVIQEREGADAFGTYIIFTFGGFMGLGLGLLAFIRESNPENEPNRRSLHKYIGRKDSAVHSIVGAAIIFVLLPVLSYIIDAYIRYSSFNVYNNPFCLFLGMVGGAVMASGISCLRGYLILRDVIHGMVAGAVATGASAHFITAPVLALLAGSVGGLIQTIIHSCFEQSAAEKGRIVSTVSWSMFGFQGLVGAAFAASWKAVRYEYFNNFTNITTPSFQSYNQFLAGLIAAGIGLFFGLLAGVFVFCLNGLKSNDYFDDYYYWLADDGIRLFVKPKQPSPEPQPVSQPMKEETEFDQIEISIPEDEGIEYGAYL